MPKYIILRTGLADEFADQAQAEKIAKDFAVNDEYRGGFYVLQIIKKFQQSLSVIEEDMDG